MQKKNIKFVFTVISFTNVLPLMLKPRVRLLLSVHLPERYIDLRRRHLQHLLFPQPPLILFPLTLHLHLKKKRRQIERLFISHSLREKGRKYSEINRTAPTPPSRSTVIPAGSNSRSLSTPSTSPPVSNVPP